jgi:RHS repeat-associated protein
VTIWRTILLLCLLLFSSLDAFALRAASPENPCTGDFHTGVYRARYYKPEVGRFWTADDGEQGSQEDPQSLHLYVYCNGSPVNAVDRSGREGGSTSLLSAISISAVLFAQVSPASAQGKAAAQQVLGTRARPSSATFWANYPIQVAAYERSEESGWFTNALEQVRQLGIKRFPRITWVAICIRNRAEHKDASTFERSFKVGAIFRASDVFDPSFDLSELVVHTELDRHPFIYDKYRTTPGDQQRWVVVERHAAGNHVDPGAVKSQSR